MIAVVIPAHDEEAMMAECLKSVLKTANYPALSGEDVLAIVVLDSCTDRTEAIAESMGALTIQVDAKNVGVARRVGAEFALTAGARWLAFTDADSVVSPDWLSAQLATGCDAVCGTIGVREWSGYGQRMRDHFDASYTDRDGHRHVHGANLGVSARAYKKAGGFQPLNTGEDVALVEALQASGADIAWSAAPRVITSARRQFRAPGGFGATLARIHQHGLWLGASAAAS